MFLSPAPNMRIKSSATLLDWQKNLSRTTITVAPHQALTYFFIQGIGTIQDRSIDITLRGGSSLALYGIIIGSQSAVLKTTVQIRHAAASSTSRVVIKGMVTDAASALINGNIIIEKNGHNADAYLEERVLLVSEAARAETLPRLEILADDVKASHAATVGRISDDELFYLETRGIDRAAGEKIMVNAFLATQLAMLPDETIRGNIEKAIAKALGSD